MRNSLNGKTDDYIATRYARSDYGKIQLRLSLYPSLILLALVNRVQELRKRRGRPRPPYLLLTSISPSRAQDIYFEDITDVRAEATEFARKSTMQNYCPHASSPVLEFECVDEESCLPHRRATLCSFTPAVLWLSLNVFTNLIELSLYIFPFALLRHVILILFVDIYF